MTDPYVSSLACAYDDCTMPVEIVDVRFFHSSDPDGHTCVLSYRCLDDHRWIKDLPPEMTHDALQEMFG